ncbi:hypothetical protein EB796_015676 [Bugula neritina]|uniref:Reverse transcriptase/retrotransposon-derived protein RNase H-like domain-containing protein n=1 Tax=Bugula neritina TaxID=10212 RepID=A0A7J7JIY0_BUGNE|nr:hypothetical protein EB796_015676 [Bugula neritina]
MVNYLSKFSSRLAGLCLPIHAVTGNKSDWYWGPDQAKAFEDIKGELSKAPILCNFNAKSKHRVSADSSSYAIGAVLLQLNGKHWQPVVYASRKLSEAETRYAMIEKEALATTWACEKFDYYLVGRKFEVETDHKPLVPILGEKDLTSLPIRVQRFKLRLMRYDFEIFHTPGSKMYLADALSRPCSGFDGSTDYDKAETLAVEEYVRAIVDSSLYSDCRLEEIQNAVADDEFYHLVTGYLVNGWPPSYPGEAPNEFRRLYGLLPTNLPEAKKSDVPTTSKEFEYGESDPQRDDPANSDETSQEEVLHTLDSDASFSEEVGTRTTDPEEVVETDDEQASIVTRSGRQIRNKKIDDYVYY